MADLQPPIVEGATTGDVEDELQPAVKSAEDRKAAASLSTLDTPREHEAATAKDIDHVAIQKAMDRLTGGSHSKGPASKDTEDTKEVKKTSVKVAPGDVTLLMEELEICKAKATDLLKAHDGDLVKALKDFVTPVV